MGKKRVAIITGGGGGIGSATARALAKEGCAVAIVDNNEDSARTLTAELSETAEAAYFICDLSQVSEIEKTFQAVLDRFGQADILVNAAGMPVRETIAEIDEAVWDRFMNTNTRSAFFLSKLLAMHVEKRGSGYGRIINLSSIRTELFDETHSGYSISKAALESVTKCFAVCYGGAGVTANAIAPGFVRTPMTEHYLSDPSAEGIIAAITPVKRVVESQEIADLTVFLCSEKAGAVSGQIIAVNGGGMSMPGLFH